MSDKKKASANEKLVSASVWLRHNELQTAQQLFEYGQNLLHQVEQAILDGKFDDDEQGSAALSYGQELLEGADPVHVNALLGVIERALEQRAADLASFDEEAEHEEAAIEAFRSVLNVYPQVGMPKKNGQYVSWTFNFEPKDAYAAIVAADAIHGALSFLANANLVGPYYSPNLLSSSMIELKVRGLKFDISRLYN